MSQNLYDAIFPNKSRFLLTKPSHLLALILIVFVSACAPLKDKVVVEDQPTPAKVETTTEYDPSPIIPASKVDARFAQEALNKTGFNAGPADGLWGPRSASAMREFESKNMITSANGHLSELNLHSLELASGLSRGNYQPLPTNKKGGILAKLDKKVPLSAGPQLIIIDREYTVLSKPNPYSSELLKLSPGMGIYVISKQDGYFEVESINRKRGYVRAD